MLLAKCVRPSAVVLGLLVLLLLTDIAAAQTTKSPISAYMLLGPGGERIARVVIEIKDCPALFVDGRVMEMQVRAPAGTAPLRPTASKPELSKPSAFPATVCEAMIPPAARNVSIHGWSLPLPPKVIRRIVVIGDTGCRIKSADNAVQNCNDRKAYPFATVAEMAATWKPDIVLHVGDYLYRENPCPDGAAICAGSPWGYGLDAWRADFLDAAAPLLKVAPWAMVRGNHESCNRAGQGWQRLFDPYPLTANRSCDDPIDDNKGDFAEPFAVPLGQGAQIVIWDTSSAGNKAFPPDDAHAIAYMDNVRRIAALTKLVPHTILANHHPVLAVAARTSKDGRSELATGNKSLQDILARADPKLYPAKIDLLLSGHVHVWEQLSFARQYPSQIVAGFSGTQEDIVPLPESLPADMEPAPGAKADAFSSWVDGFGYMTLERMGPAAWKAEIHDTAGKIVNRCTIKGRISKCAVRQVHAG
ncbi:MAG: metallophosphoesterase [Rhodospirillales bacterium]|nr:metallophosphoesterase [Rhodospirillales bacterium]